MWEKILFNSIGIIVFLLAWYVIRKWKSHKIKGIRRLSKKEYHEFKIKEHEDAIEKLKSEINEKEE